MLSPTQEFAYYEGDDLEWNGGPRAIVAAWQKVADGAIRQFTRSFYDGLGRPVQTQQQADDWTSTDPVLCENDGHDIIRNTQYDALGRVLTETLPYEVDAYDCEWVGGNRVAVRHARQQAGVTGDALGRTTG